MYKNIIIWARTINELLLGKVCPSRKHIEFDRMTVQDYLKLD